MGEVQDARDVKKTVVAPAVKSFEHYDFPRAKICCSLTWLVAKAYGTESIPADLKDPFYTDQYEQEHLKPPLASLLLSADLYCRAGSMVLSSDADHPLLGHDAVVQALAQRGLYVTDQERLVTERDLRKRPLQMEGNMVMYRYERALLHSEAENTEGLGSYKQPDGTKRSWSSRVEGKPVQVLPVLIFTGVTASMFCSMPAATPRQHSMDGFNTEVPFTQDFQCRRISGLGQHRLVAAISAHMAMIDTLMMAYTVEMVSVEKVMACICQYSYRDPEVETPYDTEDAVNTWINK
ncbi:hypothetical protein NQZ68_004594, partial [Dissostichus eleginoides]